MISLNGINIHNKVLASGSLGFGFKKTWFYNPEKFGAVITSPVYLKKFDSEGPSKEYRKKESTIIKQFKHEPIEDFDDLSFGLDKVNIILSLRGYHEDEYIQMIEWANMFSLTAIEIDISGTYISNHIIESYTNFFNSIKDKSSYPVVLKISHDNIYAAVVAEECGINAIRISEYMHGIHENVACEITGKFITPIMAKAIFDLKRKIEIPIMAGGIYSVDDAKSLTSIGASAVIMGDSLRWHNFRLRKKIEKALTDA